MLVTLVIPQELKHMYENVGFEGYSLKVVVYSCNLGELPSQYNDFKLCCWRAYRKWILLALSIDKRLMFQYWKN